MVHIKAEVDIPLSDEEIGRRIRALRTLQDMSVLALATFSGIVESTVLHLESGEGNVRASTAVRLADAIGVHPHELFLPTEQSGIQPSSRDPDGDDA